VGMLGCVESDSSLSNQQPPFPTLGDWNPECHNMVKPPTGRVTQAREPDRAMQSDDWRANVMALHRGGKTAAQISNNYLLVDYGLTEESVEAVIRESLDELSEKESKVQWGAAEKRSREVLRESVTRQVQGVML
jgi:hypothetical protein